MKTKSLSIAIVFGIFMLTFVSCCTNAKLRRIEKRVVRLEKNYKDMTYPEFNKAYDNYMDELDKISEGELTKNQKDKKSNLKWRLRRVWLKYKNPFGEYRKEFRADVKHVNVNSHCKGLNTNK